MIEFASDVIGVADSCSLDEENKCNAMIGDLISKLAAAREDYQQILDEELSKTKEPEIKEPEKKQKKSTRNAYHDYMSEFLSRDDVQHLHQKIRFWIGVRFYRGEFDDIKKAISACKRERPEWFSEK